MLAARLGLVLLVALLPACGADPAAPPVDDGLGRLDAAVGAVDDARTALLDVPGAAVPVLTAYDDADEAAGRGDRAAAGAAVATAKAGQGPAREALGQLPDRADAYRTALDELQSATSAARGLDEDQRTALATVAAGGRNEAGAVEASGTAVQAALPAYDALGAALATWTERAAAGWYRTPAESAGAYALLAAPARPALDQARSEVGAAERRRGVEVEAQRERLAAADAALAPLRAPG